MIEHGTLLNYVGGAWERSAADTLSVDDPATGEVLVDVPLSSAAEVDKAVRVASAALPAWRRTPAVARRACPIVGLR
jgi:malonate-semialdehyde dehydrogenase (acetylating)/methylmalonate-semialdehyde dehydrogenase